VTTVIRQCRAAAYRVPTDRPEADGTLAWNDTTLVLARVEAGDEAGLGYSYTHEAAAALIARTLAPLVEGRDPFDIAAAWEAMARAVRNFGRPGLCASAIAAVDVALWDLKARLLGIPLVALLGARRDSVPAYASGGFTSYSLTELEEQVAEWSGQGFEQMKIKVGRAEGDDLARARAARAMAGAARLMVDANGAYGRKQACALAERFADLGVVWFEEPVSSDDLDGLRLIRERAPAPLAVAAGEYGYDLVYYRRLLQAEAVDVVQADVTRCAGITGLLGIASLAEAFGVPLSAHTAPALHLHPCCALPNVCHVEYFHDHARIEGLLFEGAVRPAAGRLRPDTGRPGLGLQFDERRAERFRL
jgi:L-alanine-DL-glutamate epimerase-like enolase superfamily enzyme